MDLDRNRFIGGDSVGARRLGRRNCAHNPGGRLHQMIAALSNAIGHRLSNAE
jgi:hypothetical protein